MPSQIEKKIESLRKKIREHDYKYYILTEPAIGDEEYDNLVKVLEQLEAENPELITPDSPTRRVSNDLTKEFRDTKFLGDEPRLWEFKDPQTLAETERNKEKRIKEINKPTQPAALTQWISKTFFAEKEITRLEKMMKESEVPQQRNKDLAAPKHSAQVTSSIALASKAIFLLVWR